ncbi:hypothetical protein Ssi02_08070 [Sinosporangium siamense]|uniref:Uncharacterized protein n=1 Tax=Sinosporangium siamense TaxID=1367973 RepID=A0A919RAW7_9ACTN|nr:hypothetical protein Ssi02_08070 [Sinosporangium siamense]
MSDYFARLLGSEASEDRGTQVAALRPHLWARSDRTADDTEDKRSDTSGPSLDDGDEFAGDGSVTPQEANVPFQTADPASPYSAMQEAIIHDFGPGPVRDPRRGADRGVRQTDEVRAPATMRLPAAAVSPGLSQPVSPSGPAAGPGGERAMGEATGRAVGREPVRPGGGLPSGSAVVPLTRGRRENATGRDTTVAGPCAVPSPERADAGHGDVAQPARATGGPCDDRPRRDQRRARARPGGGRRAERVGTLPAAPRGKGADSEGLPRLP